MKVLKAVRGSLIVLVLCLVVIGFSLSQVIQGVAHVLH